MSRADLDNVLAIDTATQNLNLALRFGGDRSVKSSSLVEKTHGQIIIKKIEELFQSAGGNIDNLQAVVVSLGPGSFTGLRIGLAAAKGIAVARDIPLVGVGLFEVAARRLGANAMAHVLIPSRKGEYYVGGVDNTAPRLDSIQVAAESDLSALIGRGPAYGIGFDPVPVLSPIIPGLVGEQLEYDGGDLLQVGLEKLRLTEPSDPAALEPIYLQKAIAEIRFDQRQGGR